MYFRSSKLGGMDHGLLYTLQAGKLPENGLVTTHNQADFLSFIFMSSMTRIQQNVSIIDLYCQKSQYYISKPKL